MMGCVRAGAVVTSMACLMGAHAVAATVASIMPPPGLYRIDSSTTSASGPATTQVKEDGASGEQQHRDTIMGQRHEYATAGNGPVTVCYGPRVPSADGLAVAAGVMARCPSQTTKVVGDTIVHSAQCAAMRTTLTIRRVDKASWDFQTRVEALPAEGPVDFSPMRPVLENAARNGATPEERAAAARSLTQLPTLERDANRARADTAAQLMRALAKVRTEEERDMLRKAIAGISTPGAAAPQATVVRQRYTRIADTCIVGAGVAHVGGAPEPARAGAAVHR